jgi:multiple sugar transport system permease protein
VRVRRLLLLAALGVIAVLSVAPLLWMLSLSLMPTGEANAYPPRLVPSRVTLEHYRTLFTRLDMWHYVVNSALLAGSVTVISVFINGMAGYAFAKLRFAGRDGLYRVLAGAMVIPGQVTMLPLFLMVKELGLVNTYAGGIFLVRQYAFAIPEDLLDAARVDGASEWRIFRSVVVPVIRPILLTLAVFTFMGAWNDFLWPLIVLSNDARYTLPVALANLSLEHVQDTELMMAGGITWTASRPGASSDDGRWQMAGGRKRSSREGACLPSVRCRAPRPQFG